MLNKITQRVLTILMTLLLSLSFVPEKAVKASNSNISEATFLNMLISQFAANEVKTMPNDGTYKYRKEYHLAKRLGLPVVGTSYTPFGDDKINHRNAAVLVAQGITGKVQTEKQAFDWLEKIGVIKKDEFLAVNTFTKTDAENFLKTVKQKGFSKLIKNQNGKIGKYRVDSFFKPVNTYDTYEEAYTHAKRYTYTKVVDTTNGMVLWYPKNNSKILYHLKVDGKWSIGFDTEENALAYAKKLTQHNSRVIDGKINHSVWDNYDHYAVKNLFGQPTHFKTLEEAYRHALATNEQNSLIHPLDDDVNKYKHQFLSQKAASIQNGVLIYNGYEIDKKKRNKYELDFDGVFPKDFFKPYIAYHKDGSYVDRFFDTFIILGRYYSDKGRFEETPTNLANYKEWKWYKDRTFRTNGAIHTLNHDVAAIPTVDSVKVYVAIPYPKDEGKIIKLDGKSVNADYSQRLELVKWYMNEVAKEFNSGKFKHLNFEGFYWLNETVISKEDEKLVSEVGKLIQAKNKRFIFSPHSKATNFRNWKSYGFDAAYFQSNARKDTNIPYQLKQLHWGYLNSYSYGMGVNLEIEDTDRSQISGEWDRFTRYMELGKRYRVQDSSTIMYQGTVMIHRFGTYKDPGYREMYDHIYDFLKK